MSSLFGLKHVPTDMRLFLTAASLAVAGRSPGFGHSAPKTLCPDVVTTTKRKARLKGRLARANIRDSDVSISTRNTSQGKLSHTSPSPLPSSLWMSFPLPPHASNADCASVCVLNEEQLYVLRAHS